MCEQILTSINFRLLPQHTCSAFTDRPMARQVTCPKCHRRFTEAQYRVHKFSHLHNEALQEVPTYHPTSSLIPIEVPEEDITMADNESQDSPKSADDSCISDNNSSLGNHETLGDPPQYNDPFSDDHAMLDSPAPGGTPSVNSSHPFPPALLDDDEMNISSSAGHSEDDSGQHQTSLSPPNKDTGFEDSGLDPASASHLSLSEQLHEKFLKEYHSEGVWC